MVVGLFQQVLYVTTENIEVCGLYFLSSIFTVCHPVREKLWLLLTSGIKMFLIAPTSSLTESRDKLANIFIICRIANLLLAGFSRVI